MYNYYLILLVFIEIGFSNGLFINEFLALNDSCCTDENGANEDFIEIYNYGEGAVDIGGYFITDTLGNIEDYFQIPTGNDSTIIQPGDFLLLWADKDSNEGVLHVEIKLSGDGEQIGLYMQDAMTVVDTLTFGEQTTDIAYGRYPDGSGNWQFMNPTPGITNTEELTINDNKIIPDQYTLYQNYPNPFNPVTTISFSVSISAKVKIVVYDIVGNHVGTILNQTFSVGAQSVTWNAKDRPSGVYFIRMESGDFLSTQKVMLLK